MELNPCKCIYCRCTLDGIYEYIEHLKTCEPIEMRIMNCRDLPRLAMVRTPSREWVKSDSLKTSTSSAVESFTNRIMEDMLRYKKEFLSNSDSEEDGKDMEILKNVALDEPELSVVFEERCKNRKTSNVIADKAKTVRERRLREEVSSLQAIAPVLSNEVEKKQDGKGEALSHWNTGEIGGEVRIKEEKDMQEVASTEDQYKEDTWRRDDWNVVCNMATRKESMEGVNSEIDEKPAVDMQLERVNLRPRKRYRRRIRWVHQKKKRAMPLRKEKSDVEDESELQEVGRPSRSLQKMGVSLQERERIATQEGSTTIPRTVPRTRSRSRSLAGRPEILPADGVDLDDVESVEQARKKRSIQESSASRRCSESFSPTTHSKMEQEILKNVALDEPELCVVFEERCKSRKTSNVIADKAKTVKERRVREKVSSLQAIAPVPSNDVEKKQDGKGEALSDWNRGEIGGEVRIKEEKDMQEVASTEDQYNEDTWRRDDWNVVCNMATREESMEGVNSEIDDKPAVDMQLERGNLRPRKRYRRRSGWVHQKRKRAMPPRKEKSDVEDESELQEVGRQRGRTSRSLQKMGVSLQERERIATQEGSTTIPHTVPRTRSRSRSLAGRPEILPADGVDLDDLESVEQARKKRSIQESSASRRCIESFSPTTHRIPGAGKEESGKSLERSDAPTTAKELLQAADLFKISEICTMPLATWMENSQESTSQSNSGNAKVETKEEEDEVQLLESDIENEVVVVMQKVDSFQKKIRILRAEIQKNVMDVFGSNLKKCGAGEEDGGKFLEMSEAATTATESLQCCLADAGVPTDLKITGSDDGTAFIPPGTAES